MHIAPYAFAHGVGSHDPDRRRRLLLHAEEIAKLSDRVAQERLTLVPLSLYLKEGRVKVELGLARGKQLHDRRRDIAERDARRNVERELADAQRGR